MHANGLKLDYSQNPVKIQFSDEFNVAVHLVDRHINEGRSSKTIIKTFSGQNITYAELYENVNRFGNILKNMGLKKGSRVLMIIRDCPEFFYTFLGSIKAGFIPAPINTILRSKDYMFFIEDTECSALFYSSEFKAEVEPAVENVLKKPSHVICVDGEEGELVSLINTALPELEAAPASATDDCFILYSSGSTGNPKGAVHSHRDMIVTGERSGSEIFHVNKDSVNFSAAKLFFAYGLGNGLSFPLFSGGSVILDHRRPTPETVIEIIEKFKPTHFFAVPTLYARMLNELDLGKYDLSSIKISTSAGEALPPELFNRWKKATGSEILDGIGSTENLHSFISNRINDVKPGSSGRLLSEYYAKITDEDGNEVSAGEIGQLMIKSMSAAKRYWNNPEKTSETMANGWLYTGDTYRQDEKGYFYYCGRNDDMLKVGGIWCSPFEIEARLFEHPKVLEAAVIGFADDNNLIKPMAYITLKNSGDANDSTELELRDFCKKGLAPYKYPKWVKFVDELPKTATGKIQRYKLRNLSIKD